MEWKSPWTRTSQKGQNGQNGVIQRESYTKNVLHTSGKTDLSFSPFMLMPLGEEYGLVIFNCFDHNKPFSSYLSNNFFTGALNKALGFQFCFINLSLSSQFTSLRYTKGTPDLLLLAHSSLLAIEFKTSVIKTKLVHKPNNMKRNNSMKYTVKINFSEK